MSSILDRSPSCGHGAVSSPSSPARSSCNRALCSLPVCPLTIGAGPSRHWRSGRPRLRNRRSATGRARRQEARSGHRGAPPRRPRSPARRIARSDRYPDGFKVVRGGAMVASSNPCQLDGTPPIFRAVGHVHQGDVPLLLLSAGSSAPRPHGPCPVGAAFKSPVHPAGGPEAGIEPPVCQGGRLTALPTIPTTD